MPWYLGGWVQVGWGGQEVSSRAHKLRVPGGSQGQAQTPGISAEYTVGQQGLWALVSLALLLVTGTHGVRRPAAAGSTRATH